MLEIAVKELLEEIVSPMIGKKKVKPVFGTGKPPFVTYTITPLTGGLVKESQVEVKYIDSNIDKALMLREAVTKVLDLTEQMPSICLGDFVIRSKLSGGGILFNDSIQMWELSSIYIFDWRVKDAR